MLRNHVAAGTVIVEFVWRTRFANGSGRPGSFTAAMMAKVVPDLRSFERLYNEVSKYGCGAQCSKNTGLPWRSLRLL